MYQDRSNRCSNLVGYRSFGSVSAPPADQPNLEIFGVLFKISGFLFIGSVYFLHLFKKILDNERLVNYISIYVE